MEDGNKYIGNPNNLPSPTRTFHTDTYPAIDPTRPALSLKGKKVIVTGGGSGIGRETVRSFAKAGADVAILGGRRANLLQGTKEAVTAEFPDTSIQAIPVDVTDRQAVQTAAKEIGEWDVLVLNSAYLSNKGNLEEVDIDDWWRAFEVALKGTMIILQALLPQRLPGASVLATSSLVINYEINGVSSYIASKLALTRMMESLASETSNLHVVSFHPGGVDTDMYDKFFGENAAANKAAKGTDALQLPADFAVWLASPEARFLHGRFVYANWDVTELIGLREKIESEPFLKANIVGWPFSPPA